MALSRFVGAGLAAAVLTLAACGDSTNATSSSSGPASQPPVATATPVAACVPGSISADGSSAIKALIQKAADNYQAQCSGATITVAATNSSTGVTKAASGAVDIGDSDIPTTLVQGVDASSLVDHPVAIVLFAVVVNPQAGVTNLTSQQIRDIFSGKDTNWSQVGGASLPISVFERTAGSGTRFTFDKDLMQGTDETANPAGVINTTQSVVQSMSTTPGGIAYITNSSVAAPLQAVSIDGTQPSGSAVASGSYPFFSHEHCFTKAAPSQLVLSFLQYIQSSTFQNGDLVAQKYLPLTTTTRKAAVDQ
jgi:phosphate transport system substrate-binding protein